jgi:hypothetical protein
MGDLSPLDILSFPAPNFVDPESRREVILGAEIPLTVIMTVLMWARMFSKWQLKAVGLDDWLMLLCWVSSPVLLLAMSQIDLCVGVGNGNVHN